MSLTQYLANGGTNPANPQKKTYIIGMLGVAGCDYNFTAPANTTEQRIQLGATTIIPALASVTSVVLTCLATTVGATVTANVGTTAGLGGGEYISDEPMSTINLTTSTSASVTASSVATSVYFGITPSANWSGDTLGKWKVSIYFNP